METNDYINLYYDYILCILILPHLHLLNKNAYFVSFNDPIFKHLFSSIPSIKFIPTWLKNILFPYILLTF